MQFLRTRKQPFGPDKEQLGMKFISVYQNELRLMLNMLELCTLRVPTVSLVCRLMLAVTLL